MKQGYKKLFDIKYNNKIFTIFLAPDNRKAFLEKGEDGKYLYPTLEDFKVLNDIYNNHNPLVFNDIHDYFFKEKVRLVSGIMAVVVSGNIIADVLHNYQVEQVTDEYVTLVIDDSIKVASRTFSDVADLDKILGYKTVSKEQVFEAIDNNSNLGEEYKNIARNLVDKVLEVEPDFDLQIFYENIKDLEVVELTLEEEKTVLGENVAANYNSYYNRINLSSSATLGTIYHEFVHAMQSCCFALKDGSYIFRLNNNVGLNEAMNNKIVSKIIPKSTYYNEGIILDYLLSFTDYSIADYNKYGIDELVVRLQKEYPEVDFNYISNFVNAISDTENNLPYSLDLNECPDFLDEVFKLALASVNLDGNVYEPFVNFAKLLQNNQETFNVYLEKYNNHLQDFGYKDIITVNKLNDLVGEYDFYNYVAIYNHKPYLAYYVGDDGNRARVFLIRDGKMMESSVEVLKDDVYFIPNMDDYIKTNYLKYSSIYNTQEFWDNLITENNLIDRMKYEKVPVYWNGEFLGEEYLADLQVGIEKVDGKINFSLIKKSDPIEIGGTMLRWPLLDYLALYQLNGDKLELADVFNEAYLKYEEQKCDIFKDIILKDDKILVMPKCIMLVEDEIYTSIGYFDIILEDGMLSFPLLEFSQEFDSSINVKFGLYDVLYYYDLLDENERFYYFSMEELIDIVTKYINEYYLQISSNISR